MKKYLNYKDSGVEWLGEIPEHWEVVRLKNILKKKRFAIVDGPFGTQLPASAYQEYGIPLIRISNLSFKGKMTKNKLVFISEEKASEVARSSIELGDVVVAKTGATIGKVGINLLFDYGIIASSCIKFSPNYLVVNPIFIKFLAISNNFQSELLLSAKGSTRDTINIQPMSNFKVILPPLLEQEAIANYLDEKTAKIDLLVELKEKQIELLKEQRTALINQAVTKGLNPNAKMKDSGIEWLGEIPEHWENRKISRSFKTIGSGTTPQTNEIKFYENGKINWLITGDLNDGILEETSKKITDLAFEKYSTLKIFPKGSLAIALYGATIGKVSLLDFETCTNQACCVIGDSEYFNEKFTFFWFLANKQNIINLSYGGGQPNISQDIIRSLKMTSPPLSEQEAIANYLDEKTAKIDESISKAESQIEFLKEYRTALISEAVTGKIDVRG